MEEVFEDPKIKQNGSVIEREHPTGGRMREARPGAQFGVTVPEQVPMAPLKGEHTDEILAELGIQDEEREQLRADGVLGP